MRSFRGILFALERDEKPQRLVSEVHEVVIFLALLHQ